MSFVVENERRNLHESLANSYSRTQRLFLITKFFQILFKDNQHNLIQAYFPEFENEYIAALNKFSPMGIHPFKTETILNSAENVKKYISELKDSDLLNSSCAKIKEELNSLKRITGWRIEEEIV